MTSEVRTLFLGILTLVVYAASIFITQGSLIFPFPLNEFIFLAISTQFFFVNWKGNDGVHEWLDHGLLLISVLRTDLDCWSCHNDQAKKGSRSTSEWTFFYRLRFRCLVKSSFAVIACIRKYGRIHTNNKGF